MVLLELESDSFLEALWKLHDFSWVLILINLHSLSLWKIIAWFHIRTKNSNCVTDVALQAYMETGQATGWMKSKLQHKSKMHKTCRLYTHKWPYVGTKCHHLQHHEAGEAGLLAYWKSRLFLFCSSVPQPTENRAIARLKAENAWLQLAQPTGVAVHIFRLGGIYGPGRRSFVCSHSSIWHSFL
jgi:hypothetical protein